MSAKQTLQLQTKLPQAKVTEIGFASLLAVGLQGDL